MPKRRLLWHLFPSYALIALVAVLGIGWAAIYQFDASFLDAARSDLRSRVDFLDSQLGPEVPADRADFARLCRRYTEHSGVRITLLLPDGKVDSDSRNRPEDFEDQWKRPEIQAALSGEPSDRVRYHPGLEERVMYLAAPVMRHDKLIGVFYLSTPLTGLDQSLERMLAWILLAGLLIGAAAIGLAWWSARGIASPLEQASRAARRLAGGEWGTRVTVPDAQELAEVADAFNRMAEQLQGRIGILARQNNEQQAVSASMAEGVLAVDSQERLISSNAAAGRMLSLDPAQVHGRRLQEVVRNADLSRFISRALAGQQPMEADVLLHGDRQRVMQARGSTLHDLEGHPIGAVVVLNDVTDFRRLENIRRDFVANVSHELKTPVTSIKGFVETLLDGAMKDPLDCERFLRIVAKQADRLHAIIEDLLSLSKIEENEDYGDIVVEPTALQSVLESALASCQPAAQERGIEITLDCDPRLQANVNAVLLEQAVVNLLDNAIKYSEPGRPVSLSAAAANGEALISVEDHGCGIASQHAARIFERFYRVDPARSRKLGGTGLGLAIVKHIVQAHRGRVSVSSTLGVGSTFIIRLPRAATGD